MGNRDDIESLGERIAEHAAHLDAATHRLLTDLRTFDQAGGWYQQSFKSFAGWLAWRVGWDPITAREHVRVALKLGSLPQIDEALRRGELSYSKVRAMTRVATPANEAMLLEQSRYSTGAQLERICKKYAAVQRHDDTQPTDDEQRRYVRRSDTADGMVKIEALLHPEEAALVWAGLERIAAEQCRVRQGRTVDGSRKSSGQGASAESSGQGASAESSGQRAFAESQHASVELGWCASAGSVVAESADLVAVTEDSAEAQSSDDSAESRPRDLVPVVKPLVKPFDRAEALVAIMQDVLRGTRKDRAPTDLVVTVTAETLAGRDDSIDVGVVADGTCVSATAARRLACDCGVVDVLENERGVPLSVGRKRRTIPGTMKRALLRRDRTCRFPGCTTRVFLEGHHLKHWADGGETKLGNLLSLCSHHHRYVHEYGFTISVDSVGSDLLFLDRRGRPVRNVPERSVVRGSGWPAILESNAHLGITSETLAHGWDGSAVDYSACIDAILSVDA